MILHLLLSLVIASTLAQENLFDAYEECLNRKLRLLEINRGEPPPTAILVQRGSPVEMECGICYRPDVDWTDTPVTWYRVRPELKESEMVPIGQLNYRLSHDKGLVIDSTGTQHGASYLCIYRGLVEGRYYLEVTQHERRQLVVTQGKGKRPRKEEVLPKKNLRVFSSWSDWSKCSACDKVGFRKRSGICTVQKIAADEPSKPVNVRALDVFLAGLPCRSTSINQLAQSINQIKNRKSEIHIDYCYIACPTQIPVRNIIDKFGNLIEEISGEKVYSIHEPQRPLPPLVHRETHYIPPGGTVNFTCPRDELKGHNMRLRWENGTRPMNPIHIRRVTRGRVYIDAYNRLHFSAVRPTDSGYYSCWRNSWLVGSFRIVCERKSLADDTVPDMVFYIGTLLAISTVFCIAFQMWKSSKDRRMR